MNVISYDLGDLEHFEDLGGFKSFDILERLMDKMIYKGQKKEEKKKYQQVRKNQEENWKFPENFQKYIYFSKIPEMQDSKKNPAYRRH